MKKKPDIIVRNHKGSEEILKAIKESKPLTSRNVVESAHATLRACHFEANELKFFKPSCNFHFWCLKQMENITFWGCKIFF